MTLSLDFISQDFSLNPKFSLEEHSTFSHEEPSLFSNKELWNQETLHAINQKGEDPFCVPLFPNHQSPNPTSLQVHPCFIWVFPLLEEGEIKHASQPNQQQILLSGHTSDSPKWKQWKVGWHLWVEGLKAEQGYGFILLNSLNETSIVIRTEFIHLTKQRSMSCHYRPGKVMENITSNNQANYPLGMVLILSPSNYLSSMYNFSKLSSPLFSAQLCVSNCVLPLMASSSNLGRAQNSEIILNLAPSTGPNAHNAEKMLVGKFLCSRKPSLGLVVGGTKRAWVKIGIPVIKELGGNVFLFTFPSVQAANQVWERRPWLISENTMVVNKWNGRGSPLEVKFERSALWVQVHNLPISHMNFGNMVQLAQLFGTLFEVDPNGLEGGRWKSHARMLVEVNIQEPLCPNKMLSIDGVEENIRFKYEKLSEVCFFCGIIGHEFDFCYQRKEELEAGGSGLPRFKISLLAGFTSPPLTPPSTGRSSSSRRLIPNRTGDLLGNGSPPQTLGFNAYSTLPSPSPQHLSTIPTAISPLGTMDPPPGFAFSPIVPEPSFRSVHYSDLFSRKGSHFSNSSLCPRELSFSLEQLAVAEERETPLEGNNNLGALGLENGGASGGPNGRVVGPVFSAAAEGSMGSDFGQGLVGSILSGAAEPILEAEGWEGNAVFLSPSSLAASGSYLLDLNLGLQPPPKRRRADLDQPFGIPSTDTSPISTKRSSKRVTKSASRNRSKGKTNGAAGACNSFSIPDSQDDPGSPEAAVVRPKPPRGP